MKWNGKRVLALSLTLFTVVGAHAGEYWITPDTTYGTNGAGSGTAASPWVRSTATSFDACINGTGCVPTTGIPANSTLHLMSGTFRTIQGLTLKANWKMRGAGIEVTTVQMDSSLSPPTWALPVIGLPCCYRTDGTEVSDMTVDCNLQNITDACILAVRMQGAETKISRVKAINWGSRNGSECFILSIGSHWQYSMGMQTNCVIEECIIGPAANVTHTQGSSAITIGGAPDILELIS